LRGVSRWGRDFVCFLGVDLEFVAGDVVPVVGEEAFEGEDLAFARLRAAEVVSVRSK
jgi:hypothetical protein